MAYYGNYDDVSCKSSQNNVTQVHMVKFYQKNVVNNYILCSINYCFITTTYMET